MSPKLIPFLTGLLLFGQLMAAEPTSLYSRKTSTETSTETSETSPPASPKRVRISTNPLALVLGYYHANVDFALFDRYSLGASAGVIEKELFKYAVRAKQYGARFDAYLGNLAFESGWAFGGEVGALDLDLDTPGKKTGATTATYMDLMGRYLWAWENLGMDIGFGISYISLSSSFSGPDERSYPLPRGLGGFFPKVTLNLALAL